MKTNYLLFLVALFLMACSEQTVDELTATSSAGATGQTETPADSTDAKMEAMRQKCEAYYESMTVHDSVRIAFLDGLLANKNSKLTGNNRRFLMQLKREFGSSKPQQTRLTIEQALFPVFRIPDQKLGIIGHRVPDMEQPTEYTDLSVEKKLLNRRVNARGITNPTRLAHFPEVLDSLYPAGRPQIYLYTTKTTRKSRVQDLGHYQNECSEYYHYTFEEQQLQAGDEVLFASSLPLDLTYENNAAFDTWYRSGLMPDCDDCPNSHDRAISVAKLSGTEDLYFMYADAFPDNRELHTPLRALVAKGKNGKWLYFWYSDIDNFGCSCL